MTATKYCPECKETKSLLDFGKRSGYQSKYFRSYCKMCLSKRTSKYHKEHPEVPARANKNYRIKNRDKVNLYQREWCKRHLLSNRNRVKEYYYKNRDAILSLKKQKRARLKEAKENGEL